MASADYEVLTPERVSLQYDIAGIGSRAVAAVVDTLLQFAAMLVLVLGSAVIFGLSSLAPDATSSTLAVVVAVVLIGAFAILLGYYIFFEIVWSGQTPGKRMMGLRVIRENGYPIRPIDAVIRNLVRLVDSLPTSYAIGIITMLLNSRSKRLGDFAAGTLVVREGSLRPASLLSVPAAAVAGVVPPGATLVLRPADATLVRDFLSRRDGMDPLARAQLAQRIASAIAQRYAIQVDPDPEPFLERLA